MLITSPLLIVHVFHVAVGIAVMQNSAAVHNVLFKRIHLFPSVYRRHSGEEKRKFVSDFLDRNPSLNTTIL